MGELLNLNKKQKGFLEESIVEMLHVFDFEEASNNIASIILMDEEGDMHSLGDIAGISSNEIFKHNKGDFLNVANRFAKKEGYMACPTIMDNCKSLVLFRMKDQVDIDLATEVGLGVVYYKNEYMIYAPSVNGDDQEELTESIFMLKVYNQLKNPENIDISLATILPKVDDNVLMYMLDSAGYKHMDKLKEIYSCFPKLV